MYFKVWAKEYFLAMRITNEDIGDNSFPKILRWKHSNGNILDERTMLEYYRSKLRDLTSNQVQFLFKTYNLQFKYWYDNDNSITQYLLHDRFSGICGETSKMYQNMLGEVSMQQSNAFFFTTHVEGHGT